MDNKTYKSFTDLEVWQTAPQYKNDIKELVKIFPSVEKYRLEDQMIRSSRSIGSNIAEGYGRFTYNCIQARGSLFETMNHLIDAMDSNYITDKTFTEFKNKGSALEKLLNGYISWLRKMIDNK